MFILYNNSKKQKRLLIKRDGYGRFEERVPKRIWREEGEGGFV